MASVRGMLKKSLGLVALAVVAASCSNPSQVTNDHKSAAAAKTLADFQPAGAKFKNVLRLPEFETTPAAITGHGGPNHGHRQRGAGCHRHD